MNSDRLLLLASVATILVFFLFLFLLKSVPVSRIWSGYSVVYVEKTVSEETFLSCLEEAGCNDVITLKGQKNPFFSSLIPIMPHSFGEYLEDRLGYFSDYSKTFQLYYVPLKSSETDSQILKSLDLLSKKISESEIKASFGMDSEENYPFFVLIVISLLFFVFLFLSKNKLPFFCSSVFAPLFSFSHPFYPSSASLILYMLSFYLAQRIWGRKKAFSVLKKSPCFLLPMIVSFVVLTLHSFFLSGWKEGFLALLMMSSTVSSLYLLRRIESFREKQTSFKIVKIFSSSNLPLLYSKTAFHLLFCLIPIIFFLFAFVLSERFSPSQEKKIRLPSPSFSSVSDLPTLDDFYSWMWNVRSFPYRNLNEKNVLERVQEGQTIFLPSFEEKEGKIVQSDRDILKFNSEFRHEIDREIEKLDYGAIEKLMLSSGSGTGVTFGVREGKKGHLDGLSLCLLLSCLFVPVALLSLYTIKSRRTKVFDF